MWRRVLGIIGLVVAGFVAVVVILALLPAGIDGLGPHPQPVATYAAAKAAVQAEDAAEAKAGVPPVCRSRLLDPGKRVARVVVLLHGLGNCPAQMVPLGREFRREGDAVYIPLAPAHGLPGGVSELGALSAEGLRDYADRSVDIADGLGRQVDVVGLSMGGMLASWIAQHRADVHRSVIAAPAFRMGVVPSWVTDSVVNVFSRVPGITIPAVSGEALPHGYPPGDNTRAIAEMFGLARYVTVSGVPLANPKVQLAGLLNANDTTVSNEAAQDFFDAERRAGHPVREVLLPESLGLPHDTIDAAQPTARTDVVYPIIVALADGTRLPPLPPGTVVTPR